MAQLRKGSIRGRVLIEGVQSVGTYNNKSGSSWDQVVHKRGYLKFHGTGLIQHKQVLFGGF